MDLRRKGIETAADNTCTWLSYQILPPHSNLDDENDTEAQCVPIIARYINQRNLHEMGPERYSKWLDAGGLLWINGKAGSGKSVLIKQAIRDAEQWSKVAKGVVVLNFFFNGRGSVSEKTPTSLFRTLIWQLVNKLPNDYSISAFIAEEYRRKKSVELDVTWHIEDLKILFTKACALAKVTQIVVFLDAFDEMNPEPLNSALDTVRYIDEIANMGRQRTTFRLSVCFSSRHISAIDTWWPQQYSQFCLQEENEEDIKTYVDDVLKSLRRHRQLNIDVAPIRQEIISKANGVFLWVTLVMKRILTDVQSATQHELEARLRDIPVELNDLYRQMMQRIELDRKSKVLQMVTVVLFAERPLTVSECRVALSTVRDPPYHSYVDMEADPNTISTDLQMSRRLQYFTEGLLELKPSTIKDELSGRNIGDRIVQVLHQSVIDFFLDQGGLQIFEDNSLEKLRKNCHDYLSEACISVISMAQASRSTLGQSMETHWMNGFPFLEYAHLNCWRHIRQSNEIGQMHALDHFLAKSSFAFSAWKRTGLWIFGRSPWFVSIKQVSLLNVVVHLGLLACVRYLVDDLGADVNDMGSQISSPLGVAVDNEDYADDMVKIIELLLKRGAKMSGIGGVYGSLLQTMAAFCRPKSFSWLIDNGANIYEKGGAFGTILNAILCGGRDEQDGYPGPRLEMLRTLLDRDPNLLYGVVNGFTTFETAARNDWPKGLDLMLDKAEKIEAWYLVDPQRLLRVAVMEPLWPDHADGHSPFNMVGFILQRFCENISQQQVLQVAEEACRYHNRSIKECGKILRQVAHSVPISAGPRVGMLIEAYHEARVGLIYFLLARYDYTKVNDELQNVIELASECERQYIPGDRWEWQLRICKTISLLTVKSHWR